MPFFEARGDESDKVGPAVTGHHTTEIPEFLAYFRNSPMQFANGQSRYGFIGILGTCLVQFFHLRMKHPRFDTTIMVAGIVMLASVNASAESVKVISNSRQKETNRSGKVAD